MSRTPGELILKDPASIEPYGFNWTAYLADIGVGETIIASTYAVTPSVSPPDLALSGDGVLPGNLMTVVTLTGGTVGTRYRVMNHITTTTGVVDERSFYVLVEDR